MIAFIKKEWFCLLLVATPFAYLASIWTELPQEVPLHWNLQGEIDRWGSKSDLLFVPVFTSLLVYVLFTLVPLIDPKKRIEEMGTTYGKLKLAIVATMSVLALALLYMSGVESSVSPRFVFFIVGLLFTVLGGFMKSIKPNYFIGIRTPWTLESPYVWEKTHKFGGVLFMLGGLVICALAVLASTETVLQLTIAIGLGIAFLLIIHSYLVYRRLS
jgi:uncharacterized membrane protein